MQVLVGTLGEYVLRSLLGKGGNGEVFIATGPTGEVAIKILSKSRRKSGDGQPRFRREVETLLALRDESGVLPIVDTPRLAADEPVPWFAMPVAKVLREKLPSAATFSDRCIALRDIARALQRVHLRGYSHRDIKPDNLYWYADRYCLGDFGLVGYAESDNLTNNDNKLGPLHYLAPEMLNAPASSDGKSADVFSLAKRIWVVCADQNYPLPGAHEPSFSGCSLAHCVNDPRASALDQLLRRMTQMDPSRRPTAQECADELAVLCEEIGPPKAVDLSTAFGKLRTAMVPIEDATARDEARRHLAISTVRPVSAAVLEAAETIRRGGGLDYTQTFVPRSWLHREIMGSSGLLWSDHLAYFFEVKQKNYSWRLLLGASYMLQHDDMLTVHVGYRIQHHFKASAIGGIGESPQWSETVQEVVGGPKCVQAIAKLVVEFSSRVPQMVEEFGEKASSLLR